MSTSFDVIVIGSGFGGAVTACRLAEQGMKVLVLERGRRWEQKGYPSATNQDWVFDHGKPEMLNGWLDLRIFKDMMVAQGSGVGGGSLIYANVSVEAKPELFNQGWPPEVTYTELKPYYDRVGKMLNVQELPDKQLTRRFKLMKEAAEARGYGDRFRKLPLAVTFDPRREFCDDGEDPFNPRHSTPWVNDQGVEQGTCVHCGNCDIGCPVKAKNTLDLNYIPWAEKHGAEIRPLHVAKYIQPESDGYRVHFRWCNNGTWEDSSERAKIVILAAGSLGTTELLLRSRDQYKTLPKVSSFLGHNWSSNGDFLTPAFHKGREIFPPHGPTITSAIDFLDGAVGGQQYFIEDGGFPNVLVNYLREKLVTGPKRRKHRVLFRELAELIDDESPLSDVMPWFAQGIDADNSHLPLKRPWYAPWRRVMSLDWEIERSKGVMDAIINMHKELAHATGGIPWVTPTWTVLKNLVTPHPLGGCNMGMTAADGVVNHLGEVFNYPNLYVADGAIIPEAIGLNPSRTIAALAERVAENIPGKV